ncbi:unnamed protein product [Brachionus calyciflorus]|uniref:LIM zinc-binding domain-containing protein n=1 Tax=Brachionus calyciflorus TaxID=104777 RepID=A0A814G386_9BILA|nr:unnamed protein product [Brachionus calyciflorus]
MNMKYNFIDRINDGDLSEINQKNLYCISNSSESLFNEHNDMIELDNLLEDLYNAKQVLTHSDTSTSSSSSPLFSSPNSVSFRPKSDSSQFSETKKSNIIEAEKELEKLMSSLTMYKSDTRINRDSDRNCCYQCKKNISGQVITALGYLWHPEHFICNHCKKSIGTSIFYEKNMKPYCEQDYFDLFSPKCAACSNPILDKMLTALSKTWHVSCFVCYSCKKRLNDESFLEIKETAYCKNCYINELAPKCVRCNQAITENFISALNSYWHPDCFVCQECDLPFNSSCFYDYENLPYCEFHYHQKRGSLCSGCKAPINGRCITALNKKYHPEHFTCSLCQKKLNKGTFKENNERPFCNQCYQKLFF